MTAIDLDDVQSLVGKWILVGVTYLDADGKLEKQIQYYGLIRLENMAWHSDGPQSALVNVPTLVIEYEGKELGRFPYDKRAIAIAKSGVYRLRSNGVEITDPDLIAQWEVRRSRQKTSEPNEGSSNGVH